MKKQSDLSRLMGYAGNHRYFTYASWVLSAASALVPFVYIWKILRDVLNAAPDYVQAVNIPHYGWMAVLFAVLPHPMSTMPSTPSGALQICPSCRKSGSIWCLPAPKSSLASCKN